MQAETNLFHGYSDAAFANTDDHKSTSGYVAISEASREVYWLRSLYEELGEPQNSPSIIRGDNEGSISMTRNLQFHK
jgi:hypothetical protein